MADPSVLVVGEALVDVTVRPDGAEEALPGGSPLNVAVGVARLDVTTVLAAQVGDDEYGEQIRDHVDDSDVDLRSLPPHRDTTNIARATLDARGSATYEFELEWDPTEMPGPAGFALLHVGSIATTLLPGADAVAAMVARAREHGVPVSLDPNVRPAITPDLDDVRARVADLAAYAQVAKLSDEDAEVLWPGEADPAARLAAYGDPLVVALTRGSDPAVLRSGDTVVEVSPPRIAVADTIGAGDSFMAALLGGLVHRDWLGRTRLDADDLVWLGGLAARAAAITCSRPGADPPTAAELGLR